MKTGRIVGLFVPGILFLAMAAPCALPQSKTPPGGGNNNNKNTPSNPPVAPAPQTNPAPQKPNFQTLYISGNVVQEDGSPLPTGVVIERICGGRTKKEAYVTSSGSFSFQIGGGIGTNDVLPDASDDTWGGFGPLGGRSGQQGLAPGGSSQFSSSNLMGCELRADLAGYRSSSIILDGYTPMGTMDVGTILLSPISKTPGTTVSLTDMQAPKAAKKPMEHSSKALQKKDYPTAEKDLKEAIAAYPNYATAWYRLGMVYLVQKRNPDARDAFNKAIAADARFVNPYIQLARLAGMENDWKAVAEITEKALSLDSLDFPEGYYFNSIANYNLGKLEVAERSARKAQRLDPLHRLPRTNLILAQILEDRQDLTGSIAQLEAYLKFTPTPPDAGEVRSRIQRLGESSRPIAGNQEHP